MHNKYLFLSEKAVEQIRSAKDKDELGNAISRALGDLGFQSFHFSCFKKDKDELVYDPTCCAWAGDFFEAYRREGEARGIAFLDWVATGYDPERLEREFKPGLLSSLIADRLIRRE